MFGDLMRFIEEEIKQLQNENKSYTLISDIEIKAKLEQLERIIKFVEDNHGV